MADHQIVSHDEWLKARKELLAEEKAFDKQRDALSEKRRQMPWRKIDKDYVFQTPDGEATLSDLFGDCDQLIIYHFMFGPDWEEGCPSCSFWADNYNGTIVHLNAIGISHAVVSNAPVEKLEAYRKRMGWDFAWVSSMNNDFNRDFNVTFTEEELEKNEAHYNYRDTSFPSTEAPGISVFAKGEDGTVYHSYSTFSRGLDMLNGTYHHIDLTPNGRAGEDEHGNMHWLKRRDQYGS